MRGDIPSDFVAERAVLGAFLRDSRILASTTLSDGDFYHEPHRHIFVALRGLLDSGGQTTLPAVRDALLRANRLEAVGGPAFVEALRVDCFTTVGFPAHERLILEASVKRRLIDAGTAIVRSGHDPEVSVAELCELAESRVFSAVMQPADAPTQHVAASLEPTCEAIDRARRLGKVAGRETGFREIDKLTTGMHPGELWTLAGRPGMGKTSAALAMCLEVAMKQGRPTLLVSLEMPKEALCTRLLSMMAHVGLQEMRGGRITEDDWRRICEARARLEASALVMNTSATSITMIRREARLAAMRHGKLGLVAVDYAGKVRGRGDAREQMSATSGGCAALSKELECPVLLLAQLNRECDGRPDKRPQLRDLKESGSLEEDSDVVLFVYRDDYYNPDSQDKGIAEFIVGKQRNGPPGTVQVSWMGRFAVFSDLAVKKPWQGVSFDQ